MPGASLRAIHAVAVRLPEVKGAVLEVLDDRSIGVGQTVPFLEIEIAMDARAYPFKWVRRAVDALVDDGVLRHVGTGAVQRLKDAGEARKPPARRAHTRRPRTMLTRM